MKQDVVIIDVEKKAVKGYCKAKDFRDQFERFKASLTINSEGEFQ